MQHYHEKAKLRREKISIKQNKLYSQEQQQQPHIDTPGENESELLTVVIPEFSLSSVIPTMRMAQYQYTEPDMNVEDDVFNGI